MPRFKDSLMHLRCLAAVVFFLGMVVSLPPAAQAQEEQALAAESYLLNTESAFTSSVRSFSSAFTLAAKTKVVVSFAPQYATDFGIIPSADLRSWQQGKTVRYLLRLSGITAVRYVTLPAGSYSVVARPRAVMAYNGFAVKVRRFTNKVVDEGVTRTFVSNKSAGIIINPNNWNGMGFQVAKGSSGWLEGVFSRGSGRNVRYHLLEEKEYRRFASGMTFTSLVSGTDPKGLGFAVNLTPGKYFLVVSNRELSYSSLAITRELYQ